MTWHITDTAEHRVAHRGIRLPELADQVGTCLVEGEPGLFYPITAAGTNPYGQAVYTTAYDPTHRLVDGQLVDGQLVELDS